MLRVTGIIGALLMLTFLGFLGGWLKAVPLIIIMLLVSGLMLYDLWIEIRASNNNGNGA